MRGRPGFNWRILAWRRKSGVVTDEKTEILAGDSWQGRPNWIEGAWEFDELVIDDWFHLEQMSDRFWWIGVGNGDDFWHVNVRIDSDGQAHVHVEKQ